MKAICLFLLVSLTLFSCKKESNETSSESLITSISGKIDNWTLGSDFKIKFCQFTSPPNVYTVLDSSDIDSNGNFNITLSTIPTIGTINFGDSVQISNSSVKMSIGYLWLKVFSKSNVLIGGVNYGKFTDINSGRYPGDIGLGYYYVDKDVQITSSKSTSAINLTFSAGWNKCVLKYITAKSTELTIDFSSDNLNGAKWFFH